MAARASARVPDWVTPMLAKPDGGRLRAGPEWAYEYKLDGYRACMQIAADGTTVLTSRNGIDFTHEFADLAGVLAPALDGRAAVLDGEIVVYNDAGQIDFGLLQERRGRYQTHRSSPLRDQPFEDVPVRFLAFDLLQLGSTSLVRQPYEERRGLLAGLAMPDPVRISVVRQFTFTELAADRRTPQDLLDHVAATGHEGLVAKRLSAPYVAGKRPDYWCKHALIQTTEVIICGWRPGQNRLSGNLGGLLLGGHDPDTGDLVYIGDVGTGFTEDERSRLLAQLEKIEQRKHPFAATPPREDTARAHWVKPDLVGEVVYRQFTRGAGRLRHTAWRGLRDDRAPSEVRAPRVRERVVAETAPTPTRRTNAARKRSSTASAAKAPATPTPPVGKKIPVQAGKRRLTLSNLDKPLYPDGFTKGEVINYYSRIAEVLLPHLAGRPVTFIRFPDGVGGQQFFEKTSLTALPAGCPRSGCPAPAAAPAEAKARSSTPCSTNSPPWCGRRTWPPSSCTSHSGGSTPTATLCRRICWCSTSTPAPVPRSCTAAGSPSGCARFCATTG